VKCQLSGSFRQLTVNYNVMKISLPISSINTTIIYAINLIV